MNVYFIVLLMATTLAKGSSYLDKHHTSKTKLRPRMRRKLSSKSESSGSSGKGGKGGSSGSSGSSKTLTSVCVGDIVSGFVVDGEGTKKATDDGIAGDTIDYEESLAKGYTVLIDDAYIGNAGEWYANRDTGAPEADPGPLVSTYQFTEDEFYTGTGSLLISNNCDGNGCAAYKGFIEFTPKETRELTVGDFYSFSFRYKVKECAATGSCAYIYVSMYTTKPGETDANWYSCRFTLANQIVAAPTTADDEWYEFKVDRDSSATVATKGSPACTAASLNTQPVAVDDYEANSNNSDRVFIAVNFGDSGSNHNGMEIYVDSMILATQKDGEDPVYEVIDIEPTCKSSSLFPTG